MSVARFTAALAAVSGRADFHEMTDTALRWLLASGVPEARGFGVAGLLLAEEEARTDPLHVAIVGSRKDPVTMALLKTALLVPTAHRLVERWDRAEGPAPRGEDIYPELPRPAAFVCDHGACSAPIFDAGALASRLERAGRGSL